MIAQIPKVHHRRETMHKETTMVRGRNGRIKRIAARVMILAAIGITPLAGCSTSTPPAGTAGQKLVAATFSLSQCQPIDANIYKCPAIDKPICNPDYSGEVECIRVGKNGGVYLQTSPLQ
jgi:hypothetical protein